MNLLHVEIRQVLGIRVWNGKRVLFLVVSQPSYSYSFQHACLSVFIAVYAAGNAACGGEEGIFLWIPQHLSRHQKHTAVLMQVSLQQRLGGCQSWGPCYAISPACYSSRLRPPLPLLIYVGAAREMECTVKGIKWKKILLRCSSCRTSDLCWTSHFGLGRVSVCWEDKGSDCVSQISGSNPHCAGKRWCCQTVSVVTVLL